METLSTPSSPLDLQRYRTYLLLLARSHDKMGGDEASDLVQKTMLAAHAQRADFRGQSPAELAAWLKQILRREVIDAYRHRRRLKRDVHREVPLEAEVDGSFSRAQVCLAAVQTSPSQQVSREEELVGMADALAQLPDAQREAVVLHHLQGATLAEVAAQLQRTEAAVAGLLHRGMKRLRELLEEPSSGR
ncbi:MAG: sigma-70 family RNA polymerase sigma factor [Pirellulaceae bacterium]